MQIDVERAWESYGERFRKRFGDDKSPGSYVRFNKHMVQRLDRAAFEQRLEDYVSWHQECKSALASGSTISDALILEFEEAAAWIALDPPNVLEMFAGELGDPLSS
ncbi:MAG: hypothetical protein CMN30_25980 [Sandaracinus sp.]|nr:hypothetical protein [Sandaracinus sp.]|tara:strand:+ start:329 stop:646 length:318 start_codon:yes stop_codon:yes gene_type:complete